MANSRSILSRRSRRKLNKGFDLQLTSLLDILVIILVFLLKTFDVTSVSFATPAGMKLPISTSPIYAQDGLNVIVSLEEMALGMEQILRFKEGSLTEEGEMKEDPIPSEYLEDAGRLIVPLYEALRVKKESIEAVAASTGGQQFTGTINLVADKRLNYGIIKRIIYTAASAGFKTVKLSIQKKEGVEATLPQNFQRYQKPAS